MKQLPKITREVVYLGDFKAEADKRDLHAGVTDLYSTGLPAFDKYLFGGYGRKDGYELMVFYGDTGIGKSIISLNLVVDAILKGHKVGLAILEDDLADSLQRIKRMVTPEEYEQICRSRNVECLPPKALDNPWTLESLIEYFQYWYTKGIDIILLDHIQFAFENADIDGAKEFSQQRVFMRRLNKITRESGKTAILVSHINKNNANKGMSKIQGSSGIAGAATKVIEVEKKQDCYNFHLRKSRFTPTNSFPFLATLENMRLRELSPKEVPGATEQLF